MSAVVTEALAGWWSVRCDDCGTHVEVYTDRARAQIARDEHQCRPLPAHWIGDIEQVDVDDYIAECRCGWQRGGHPTYTAAELAAERHLEATA